MGLTDPLADMLTRIRNAGAARFDKVDIPASRMKISVARLLKEEGYIKNFKIIKDKKQGVLRVYLKYDRSSKPLINGLKRISKPSRRVYAPKDGIIQVLGGLGVAIVSTSKGILTDREARQQGVGGEVLCNIW
ncbi:30S ribosomal protein S8 [Desulfobacca acetoxidans]|uniref:Small ribosomal subunit protein uS8 n=1 Tax=Desulfobacca acetoxidans (strain ATCC 700848 / DSM 11109 / ASRB2) TaxID=880072 RepID=F2NJC5_DESAR|nr:30S ribosomal protein S8 [Desulfobacca acetoxidans]AEB09297.1 ribosomal protein S8 [Desulfobacca acetoxidans DSM 11109]